MLLQKNNLWDINFFESFLFCSCFQTRSKKIRILAISFRNISKTVFYVSRENTEQHRFFEKKFGFWAKIIRPFFCKIFQKFVKTTLYMSSGQKWGKTFFVRKINLSFLVTWANVFGNLAKIFWQACQNCLPRVHREPIKERFSEKICYFCVFVNWATIFDIVVLFWVTIVKKR